MNSIVVIPSDKFLKLLKELSNVNEVPQSIKDVFVHKKTEEIYLTTQDIKWCHSQIKKLGIKVRIHELLSESKVVIPKYEAPPRNPELEARIQILKARQENREYNKMVKDIDFSKQDPSDFSNFGKNLRELNKEINRQIVTGLQYLVSLLGTFFGMFIATGLYTPDYGSRALVGIISALIVGLAEMYFIIRDDIRQEKTEKIKKK